MTRKTLILRSPRGSAETPEASPRPGSSSAAQQARQTGFYTPEVGTELADEGLVRKIQPMDSVYSFLMFSLPMEKYHNEGARERMPIAWSWTWRSCTAMALVAITMIIKGILLYSIFNAVVITDLNWQHSILKYESKDSFMAAPEPKCADAKSLCSLINGTFSCAPPTVQLMGRWNELDTNGDGVWSRDEAVSAKDALQCKYVVNPVEVFDIFVKFVVAREELIWIHPDLKTGKSIHKAYFTYASGDLIMCGYRDEKMCSNLLQRGVFDAPLKEGVAPRVGKTIDSALNYCKELLKSGGTCDQHLPSTYTVWKTYTGSQCWGDTFEKYVYKHPKNGKEKSMLLVDYKAPKAYSRSATSPLFRIYKGVLIGIFLLAMYAELKDVLMYWTWVMRFPSTQEGETEVKVEEDSLRIQSITAKHRTIMGVITVMRFLMVLILIWVGVSFLMRDTDWVNLLLNAVALLFIMEVAGSMFTQVLDTHLQEQFLETEPMYVEMFGNKWMNAHASLRDLLGFFSLCCMMYLLMALTQIYVDDPLSKALQCACLSTGDNCREAKSFDTNFWNNYWTEDVPDVFKTVKKFKAAEKKDQPIVKIKMPESQNFLIWGGPPATVTKPSQSLQETEQKASPVRQASPVETEVPAGEVRWAIVPVKKKSDDEPIKKHNDWTMLNKAPVALIQAKVATKPREWAIADLQLPALSAEDAKLFAGSTSVQEHAESQIFERGLEDVHAHQHTWLGSQRM